MITSVIETLTAGEKDMLTPLELGITFGVALLVLGPKDLPKFGSGSVARDPLLDSRLTKWLAKSFPVMWLSPRTACIAIRPSILFSFAAAILILLSGCSPADNLESADKKFIQAETAFQQQRYDASDRLFNEALATRERLLGKNHKLVAFTHVIMASFLMTRNKLSEADKHFSEAVKIEEYLVQNKPGSNSADLITALTNLAMTYQMEKKFKESEVLLKRVAQLQSQNQAQNQSQTQGPKSDENNDAVAANLEYTAHAKGQQHEYKEAEDLLKRSLTITGYDFNKRFVAQRISYLIEVYMKDNKISEAETLCKLAASQTFVAPKPGVFSIVAENNFSIASCLHSYAILLNRTGRSSQAGEMEARSKQFRGY